MDKINETELKFMNTFSNIDISNYKLPSMTDLPIFNKFLTNEIGINYIGNVLKDIDIKLYLVYLKLLKDKIKFIDDYDVTKSVCISTVISGIIKNIDINVPTIKNGIDIFATLHELGHGIKNYTKNNNERFLYIDTIYDETISILFGKICLDRYINDFGYDNYVQQFEILNIKNAIKCLEKTKTLLQEYITKQAALDNKLIKTEKSNIRNYYKFYSFAEEVEKIKKQLYVLISYPIGLSLANVFENFNDKEKEEYLGFVSKYLLNIKQIDYEMILEYFNIPFDANFYINNFKEYINKFEEQNKKILILGVKNNDRIN